MSNDHPHRPENAMKSEKESLSLLPEGDHACRSDRSEREQSGRVSGLSSRRRIACGFSLYKTAEGNESVFRGVPAVLDEVARSLNTIDLEIDADLSAFLCAHRDMHFDRISDSSVNCCILEIISDDVGSIVILVSVAILPGAVSFGVDTVLHSVVLAVVVVVDEDLEAVCGPGRGFLGVSSYLVAGCVGDISVDIEVAVRPEQPGIGADTVAVYLGFTLSPLS